MTVINIPSKETDLQVFKDILQQQVLKIGTLKTALTLAEQQLQSMERFNKRLLSTAQKRDAAPSVR